MIYLLLNIVLSSFFILCIKWLQTRREDIVNVGMVNYVVAASVSSLLLFDAGQTAYSWSSILTGICNGVCYFVAYFVLIRMVGWQGAANIAVVTRLSIVLPIVAGIAIWGERPGVMQSLGIGLACVGLVLIGRRASEPSVGATPPFALLLLAGFFFIAGGSRLAQEVFKHVCHPDERSAFLITAFGVTAIGALGVQLVRWQAPRRFEWSIGVVLGLSNLGQTYFILKALEHYPGFIVFPLASAGGLLFTTSVAVLVLKERLSLNSYLGIGLATCALALLQPDG